jgi:hypothetical protein
MSSVDDTDMETFVGVPLKYVTDQRRANFPSLAPSNPNMNMNAPTSLLVVNSIKIPGRTAGSSATKRLQFILL